MPLSTIQMESYPLNLNTLGQIIAAQFPYRCILLLTLFGDPRSLGRNHWWVASEVKIFKMPPPFSSFRKPSCLWPSCSLQLRLAAVNLECTGTRSIRIKIYWQLRSLPLVTIYTGNYAFLLMHDPCCEGYRGGGNPDLAYLLILHQWWLEEAVLLSSRPPAFLLFQRSLAHISWCMIIRTLPSTRDGLPRGFFSVNEKSCFLFSSQMWQGVCWKPLA